LVELDLEVDTGFLLHIDDEVDTAHQDERQKDAKNNVQVEFQDSWASC
jgi:hypothetical protein